MKVIAPIVEALLAVLFIAGAPFIWAFGIWGVVSVVYSMLPASIQNSYWWEFNQERLDMSQTTRDGAALLMVFLGLYFLLGLWGAYPQYKKSSNIVVTSSFLGMTLFVLWVIGQSAIRMGSW